MNVPDLVASILRFNQATFLDKVLHGLTDADLVYRPNEHTNPMGWVLWHQTRVEDAWFSRISDQPQAWVAGQWHAQFEMAPNPEDVGAGYTLAQVMAFRPTVATVQGYAAAVREKTLAVLQALRPEDLEREVPGPGGRLRQVGEVLGMILIDHLHHSGQVCYLRGSCTPGWSPLP